MPTSPPTITAAGAIPDPSDRASYNSRAYAFMTWMASAVGQFSAAALNVFNNATEAYASASTATAAVTAAANVAGAVAFVPAQSYAKDACVISPLDQQTYRRKLAGVNAADPSVDQSNWTRISGMSDFASAMAALAFINQ